MPRAKQSACLEAHQVAHRRILACKNEKRWADALVIVAQMRAAGTPLGTISYNAAIDCCGKVRQVDRALELLDELIAVGNHPDAVTYTALIDACGRASMLDRAFFLFERYEYARREKSANARERKSARSS